MKYTTKKILSALGLALGLLNASQTSAAVIGPGDVTIAANDEAKTLLVIDLANSQALAAGSYMATTFNYQFSAVGGNVVGGSAIGLLLTFDGLNYNVIAKSDAIVDPLGGIGAFTSAAFGGSDTFTLMSTQTVYAGFYESNIPGYKHPIGFAAGGSTFAHYDSGFGGGGPDAPVVGSAVTGGTVAGFARAYDFSVNVSPSAVPEPESLVLMCGGLALLGIARRRMRTTKTS